MLHIGSQQPVIIYNEGRVLPIELRPGVRSASEMGTGLIAMPKEGRHGLSDAALHPAGTSGPILTGAAPNAGRFAPSDSTKLAVTRVTISRQSRGRAGGFIE
jgi:hypothetical protein